MAEIRSLPLLLLLLLLAAAVEARSRRSSGEVSAVSAKQREFDYFLLALQWPGTLCSRTSHCCTSNGCCRSLPLKEFTIHGLWADYDDGTWPSCCEGAEFNLTKISSLMPVIEKYWPSLSCSSSKTCHGGKGLFWAHEWEKHGTCSSPVILDEYSYFTTALDLYFKYNITRILESAGFLATNAEKYLVGDIVAAIEKAVGASPLVVCKKGSLEELRICFYKDFSPRDCVTESSITKDAVNSKSSCPISISLPTYEPVAYDHQNLAIAQPALRSWKSSRLVQMVI